MIKIKRAKNGQFYFVVLAKNHKVILTSETYKSKQGVRKGIRVLFVMFRLITHKVVNEKGKEEVIHTLYK